MEESGGIERLRASLGRQLRERRQRAGLTQRELADVIGYSRSAVASAETAYQHVAADFWARCDRHLGADSALVDLHRQVSDLRRARTAGRERAERARRDGLANGGPGAGAASGAGPADQPADPPAPVGADQQLGLLRRSLRRPPLDPGALDRWEIATRRLEEEVAGAEDGRSAERAQRLDQQLAEVVGWLDRPQPAGERARLCAVVARLAGLRASGLLEASDRAGAAAWLTVALDAAREAGSRDLDGRLLRLAEQVGGDRQLGGRVASVPDAPSPRRREAPAAALSPDLADDSSGRPPRSDRARALLGVSVAAGYVASGNRNAAITTTVEAMRSCGREPTGRLWHRGDGDSLAAARSQSRHDVAPLDQQLAALAPAFASVLA